MYFIPIESFVPVSMLLAETAILSVSFIVLRRAIVGVGGIMFSGCPSVCACVLGAGAWRPVYLV